MLENKRTLSISSPLKCPSRCQRVQRERRREKKRESFRSSTTSSLLTIACLSNSSLSHVEGHLPLQSSRDCSICSAFTVYTFDGSYSWPQSLLRSLIFHSRSVHMRGRSRRAPLLFLSLLPLSRRHDTGQAYNWPVLQFLTRLSATHYLCDCLFPFS